MKFKKSIVGVLAMLPLVAGLTLTGCSGVLPTTLEEKLMSTPTADDHLAAARLYQNKARELEAEAEEYERAVSNARVIWRLQGVSSWSIKDGRARKAA